VLKYFSKPKIKRKIKPTRAKALTWNDLKYESSEDLKKALQRCQRKLLSPNPSNIKAEIKKMKAEHELVDSNF
jgi:hypothetical protein